MYLWFNCPLGNHRFYSFGIVVSGFNFLFIFTMMKMIVINLRLLLWSQLWRCCSALSRWVAAARRWWASRDSRTSHTHTASRWRKRRITPGFNIKCIFLTTNLKFTESFLRLQNKHVRLKLQEFLSQVWKHHFRFYVI